MVKHPNLSIIVPFYNEEKNIPLVLEAYREVFHTAKNEGIELELLCVNNGSSDKSSDVFSRILKQKKYTFAKEVIVKKNIGYGHGIMTGVQKAKGEVIAWTHADMQTDAADVLRAYIIFYEQQDKKVLVKGVRTKRQLSATLFSFGMAVIASIYLRKWFYEINAQPKLFHKSTLALLNNAPDDFSLDLYLLYQWKKHRYPIKTIPVLFKNRIYGKSKWAYSLNSKIKTIFRTLKYIRALRTDSA